MDRWQYLGLMAACLLVTVPLELWPGARVYRRPRRLLVSVVPVALVFVAWDVLAIRRDHWSFSPEFTTGILLPGAIPLEEVVFFVVIPLCGLLTYEAVGTILNRTRGRSSGTRGRSSGTGGRSSGTGGRSSGPGGRSSGKAAPAATSAERPDSRKPGGADA